MWSRLRRLFKPLSDEDFENQRATVLSKTPIPVFWLFGKTQSGKTSVVKYLTGADAAQIGNGYRPETKFSSRYDFPSTDDVLLQFLDTRGLAEVAYDPEEDLRAFAEQTHLMLVTVRVDDLATDAIIEPLRTIRHQDPERPVILLLTCLHQLYPGEQHPDPDPYTSWSSEQLQNGLPLPNDEEIPSRLRSLLVAQTERFAGLVDRIIPVDLTREEEGFLESDFGGARLKETLLELLPEAYRQTFATWEDVAASLKDLHEQRAWPHILSNSLLAATAASVPVPWVDLPVVAALQLDLVRRLARVYGHAIDSQEFLKAAGLVGGPLMLRQGVRELLKFVPWVGIPANAMLGFASTFGLGKAYTWYYGERRRGYVPSKAEIQSVMREQMAVAEQLWKRHRQEPDPTAGSEPEPSS